MKSVGKSSSKDKRSGGFVYKERSADSIKKRSERTGGRFDSPVIGKVDTWRAKVGDNLIRIMPPSWDGHEHYGYPVWVHQYIGPDESNYLCLRRMKGDRCAVCDEVSRARAAGEQDEAKRLEAKEQYWCWIIDRDGDSDNPTPQIYILSWTADRDIAALCYSSRTGKVRHIDHPDEGYDLIIKRTGQGLKTRYQYQIDHDPTPLHDDESVQDQLLEYIQETPVPSVLNFYDNDYLEKMLVGDVKQKDPDEEEERPSRRSRDKDKEEEEEEKPARRRRAADEDDEEEEKPARRRAERKDEEDDDPGERRRGRKDDEDEEEEEKPRRRQPAVDEEEEERPRRRAAARDEEDEEEEKPRRRTREVVDEEEEEKPRRRTRAVEEDEEEEKPRRRRAADEDDEEEEKPRRRVAAREEKEEEEEERPRRVRSK